jgi:hypothetical protein
VKPIRLSPSLTFWALAVVTLLLSHDAVWLAQVGPGAQLTGVLRQAGHGYWGLASAVLLLVGALALTGTAWRVIALRRQARAIGANRVARGGRWDARRLAMTWLRLAALVTLSFAVQENAEHFVAHGHVLGAGALVGPEYPLAIPVIATMCAVAAVLAVAVAAVERSLELSIAHAARATSIHAPRRLDRPPVRVVLRRLAAMATGDAGRAPPGLLVTP